MSTAAAAGSIDAVRAVVGVDDVLGAYGHASPRAGRMPCPIHGGRNPSCFAVRENERFRCFRCGEHGDVVDLERALGGGTTRDALRRLCERHAIAAGTVDIATEQRRRLRLQRLNHWHRQRSNEWTNALVRAESAVRAWRCGDPADADEVYWAELDRRCTDRDIASAMYETFRELRTVEQRANAYVVEQRGAVIYPWEVACA